MESILVLSFFIASIECNTSAIRAMRLWEGINQWRHFTRIILVEILVLISVAGAI